MKLINELLNGIRIIKFFSWEQSYTDKVAQVRKSELKERVKLAGTQAFLNAVMTGSPVMVTVATFAVYSAVNSTLDPAVIFPSVCCHFSYLLFVDGTVHVDAFAINIFTLLVCIGN